MTEVETPITLTYSTELIRSKRILCLHGWRTSGTILARQTAAMQYHVPMQYCFLTAPYSASGPPDAGIARFYPDQQYYEWYERKDASNDQVNSSVNHIVDFISTNGPFDGLLGFSQGAAMATLVAHLQQVKSQNLFHFVILVGGVNPLSLQPNAELKLPSLHIMGSEDPFLERSVKLRDDYYAETKNRHSLHHNEAHNIPSLRTGLYPRICMWLESLSYDNE